MCNRLHVAALVSGTRSQEVSNSVASVTLAETFALERLLNWYAPGHVQDQQRLQAG